MLPASMLLDLLKAPGLCIASIAQLVERPLSEREVVGSNPSAAPYQRCKNGTSSSLADARIKGVVLGR